MVQAPGAERTADVDLECWFCAVPFEREQIERNGTLVPRRVRDGGPFLRYECPSCRRPVHVERNRAGAMLATPPPVVPVADALLATFDPDLRRELAAKRDHDRRRAGRREWFFGAYADELAAAGWRPGSPRPVPHDGDRDAAPPPPASRERRPPPPRSRASSAGAPPRETPPREPPPRDPVPPPEPPPPLAHELLGISADAPPEQVNAAFRDLAKRYHPDRFATLDAEFQALATKRMQQLMAAREAMLPLTPPPPTER